MINWTLKKTKYIANVTAADIPRGHSAEDVGFDEEDWLKAQEKLERLRAVLKQIQNDSATAGYDGGHSGIFGLVTETLRREFSE